MRVLAVDTTGAHGSIALLDGSLLKGLVGVSTARPRHAETLLPTIDSLLGWLSMTLSEVEGYVVAIGPGSFTGLRVGIAAVEGLAFSTSRPAMGVSALEATAYRHRHLEGLVVSIIEAYRGEIYGAAYQANGRELLPVGAPVCEDPTHFLDSLSERPELVAGTGTLRYRDRIEARFPGTTIADPSFFLAEEVARLGARRLQAGERAELGSLQALYIRPSEAERNRASEVESG